MFISISTDHYPPKKINIQNFFHFNFQWVSNWNFSYYKYKNKNNRRAACFFLKLERDKDGTECVTSFLWKGTVGLGDWKKKSQRFMFLFRAWKITRKAAGASPNTAPCSVVEGLILAPHSETQQVSLEGHRLSAWGPQEQTDLSPRMCPVLLSWKTASPALGSRQSQPQCSLTSQYSSQQVSEEMEEHSLV